MGELTGAVYMPSFLSTIAHNASMILLPLFALQFDNGAALAAIMLGVRGLGVMLADVPAGVLVSKFGDKWVMIAGIIILILVSLGAAFCASPLALTAVALAAGIGTGLWTIARLTYITDTVALQQRGRIIAVMAGVHRASALIGPILAGITVQAHGYPAAFVLCALFYLLTLAVLLRYAKDTRGSRARHPMPLIQVITRHRRTFAGAGTVMIILQFLRSARVWIIPVWGAALGLDEATIGLVFSASSLVDMLMFYPAGWMLDHLGRKVALTPALIILSAAIALLPLTASLWTYAACAVLTGLGNGFSTGIFMTLGGDFAPRQGRGEFLGVWRLVGDIGMAAGPFLIGGVAQASSVVLAGGATGALGAASLIILWRSVPEPLRSHAMPVTGSKTDS